MERRLKDQSDPVPLEVWQRQGEANLTCLTQHGVRLHRFGTSVDDGIAASIAWEADRYEAELWVRDGPGSQRGLVVATTGGDHVILDAYSSELDDDNGLINLQWASEARPLRVDDSPLVSLLAILSEQSSAPRPHTAVFVRPPPPLDVSAVDADALADAVVRGAILAVADAPVPVPSVVFLRLDKRGLLSGFVGSSILMSEAYDQPNEAYDRLGRLSDARPPLGGEIDPCRYLDSAGADQLRALGLLALNTRLEATVLNEVNRKLSALQTALLRGLNKADWGVPVDPEFVAIVSLPPVGLVEDPIAIAAQHLQAERVDRLRLKGARKRKRVAPRTEPEVLELIGRNGLSDADADQMLRKGRWAVCLRHATQKATAEPAGFLAPPGTGFSVGYPNRDCERLRLLAGLDLTRLPASDLPANGWLYFFADEDDPQLYDGVSNVNGAPARMLYTSDAPTVKIATGVTLPLAARRTFSLPDWAGADLTVLGRHDPRYCSVVEACRGSRCTGYLLSAFHFAQRGSAPAGDTTQLLLLDSDSRAAFNFSGGGSLEFRVPNSSLKSRRWADVVATSDFP